MSGPGLDGAAGPSEPGTAEVGLAEAGTAGIPVDPALIAGYLDHLGAAEVRLVVEQLATMAEALLGRLETAAAGADEQAVRHLSHDVAGTLGSLGCSMHAAMARAVEASEPDPDPVALRQRLQPLLAARGRIASAAMAALDGLLSMSEEAS